MQHTFIHLKSNSSICWYAFSQPGILKTPSGLPISGLPGRTLRYPARALALSPFHGFQVKHLNLLKEKQKTTTAGIQPFTLFRGINTHGEWIRGQLHRFCQSFLIIRKLFQPKQGIVDIFSIKSCVGKICSSLS